MYPMRSPSTKETVATSALVVLIVGLIFSWPASAMSAAASTPLVRVEMTEFRFRPSIIRLFAGTPATIELVNVGQIAHQLDAPFLRHVPVTVADN